MFEGHCNCGTVRFEISSEPGGIYVCHCSICRRSTGANGIAVVVVPNENFRWLAGHENVRSWKRPGADWESWFCGTCGSKLPGVNDPQRMYIPVGCFGPDLQLQVIHHIYVNSRASWDVIGDAGVQHPEGMGS
jgi:hypothetical protein